CPWAIVPRPEERREGAWDHDAEGRAAQARWRLPPLRLPRTVAAGPALLRTGPGPDAASRLLPGVPDGRGESRGRGPHHQSSAFGSSHPQRGRPERGRRPPGAAAGLEPDARFCERGHADTSADEGLPLSGPAPDGRRDRLA